MGPTQLIKQRLSNKDTEPITSLEGLETPDTVVWRQSHYVARASLELMNFLLWLPMNWNDVAVPPCLVNTQQPSIPAHSLTQFSPCPMSLSPVLCNSTAYNGLELRVFLPQPLKYWEYRLP